MSACGRSQPVTRFLAERLVLERAAIQSLIREETVLNGGYTLKSSQ